MSSLVMFLVGGALVIAVVVARDPRLDEATRKAWRRLAFSFLVYLVVEALLLFAKKSLPAVWLDSWRPAGGLRPLFDFLLAWAILTFPRPGLRGPSRLRFHLDLGFLVLGGSILLWSLTVQPVLQAYGGSPLAVGQSVTGSLGSLALLVALGAFSLHRPDGRLPVFLLLAGGVAAQLGAAIGLAYEPVLLRYEAGSLLPGLPALSWVLFLLAGLLQRRLGAAPTEVAAAEEPILRLSLLPYLATGGAFLFVLYHFGSQVGETSGQLVVSATLLGGAILARQYFVQRENLYLETGKMAAREERRLNALLTYSSDVTLVLDGDGSVRYASPSSLLIFGFPHGALQDAAYLDFVHPEDRESVRDFLGKAAAHQEGRPHSLEWRLRDALGGWRHVEGMLTNRTSEPGIEGLLLNMRDVTQRKTLERKLSHQALHDPLTGLANRSLLGDRARHALARAVRRDDSVALLFLDLDEFKKVNDTLGHHEGDKLLVEVAMRLQGQCRASDTVARLGGDEFAVLLEEDGNARTAERVAERIVEDLSRPYPLLGGYIPISASVGIAVAEGGLRTPEELLRSADIAMYAAKGEGKNGYRVFTEDMEEAVHKRLHLEAELRGALRRRQFVLYYQPIMSLREGRIVGVEALLRWEHPELGLLPPSRFLQLAEDTGLIVPIGRETLFQACREVVSWGSEAAESPLLCVNLSAKQLHAPGLLEIVQRALDESGLPPQRLALEITENTLIEERELVGARLHALSEVGVRLAIDDFGTGYSSLCYLKDFPVHILKLAKPFVDDLATSPESRDVVRAVLELARALDLEVVAEGIEELSQQEELLGLECPLGQGFYYMRPSAPEIVRALWQESQLQGVPAAQVG